MRNQLLQDAAFPHTAPEKEIRVDLGLSSNVKGSRRFVKKTQALDGIVEETYRISVINQRDNDILVEVNERPPVRLEWFVTRATKPYEMQSQRLLFTPEIKARETLNIDYDLRVKQPEL